jgi:hypothetical protein
MKLAVPAVEQAWAHITAAPAASLAPCYEARLLGDLFDNQKPRYGFAWYICLCSAQQAQNNIAQNGQLLLVFESDSSKRS